MDLNPAILSKINWTQIIAFAASLLAVFGLNLSPELQAAIVLAVQGVAGLLTIVWRTWFTAKPAA